VLPTPAVERVRADPMPPAQLTRLCPGIGFRQDSNDLLLREPALPHDSSRVKEPHHNWIRFRAEGLEHRLPGRYLECPLTDLSRILLQFFRDPDLWKVGISNNRAHFGFLLASNGNYGQQEGIFPRPRPAPICSWPGCSTTLPPSESRTRASVYATAAGAGSCPPPET